jgi:precorrin-2/cobalt-factor-2 C20-methyltransferase
MKTGTFYGLGVGPGDPELLTLKAASVLGACPHVFVPKTRSGAESLALEVARRHLARESTVHELIFPAFGGRAELARRRSAAVAEIAAVLKRGEDACLLTLGDALLYSAYGDLLRELRRFLRDVTVVTVPGITSIGAAAALAQFPIGSGHAPVTIVPAADDVQSVRRALEHGGTVVLMQIGNRLAEILDLLDDTHLLDHAVFVARIGHARQRVETDLRALKAAGAEAGYLSIILVHAQRRIH